MLPALQLAMEGGAKDSGVSGIVVNLLEAIGLPSTLVSALGVAAFFVTMKASLSMIVSSYGAITTLDMVRRVRESIVHSLLHAKWSYFANARAGQYVNLLGAESNRAVPALNGGIGLITGAIQTLFYVASAFLVSAPISILALGLGGMKLILVKPIISLGRYAGNDQSVAAASLGSHIVDLLSLAKPIKAMAHEETAETILKNDIRDHRNALRKGYLSSLGLVNLDELLTALILILCLFFTVNILKLSIADLAIVGILMSRTLSQIAQLQKRYFTIVSSEAALGKLITTCEELRGIQELERRGTVPVLSRGIEFQNVRISYPECLVVDNANLNIPARSLTVLTGPSGAGKTTLLDALLGLVDLEKGGIFIDSQALRDVDIKGWRKNIGYVPQETTLLHATVRENVTLGSDVVESDVLEALSKAEALEFVLALPEGLDTELGERGIKISGGQRQRISIARALVHKPELLILDEATSALDEKYEIELCRTFKRLANMVTILAVSHQRAIYDVADSIYRIDNHAVELVKSNSG